MAGNLYNLFLFVFFVLFQKRYVNWYEHQQTEIIHRALAQFDEQTTAQHELNSYDQIRALRFSFCAAICQNDVVKR